MKIVVTGSSGFIGYHLCKSLLNEGYQILGVDNHNSDYDVKIKEERAEDLKAVGTNFEFIKLDINNDGFISLLKGRKYDYFVHLAARDLYYESETNIPYSPYVTTNVLGTSKMFELAKSLSVKKFIFASTHSVYGNTKKKLLTEKRLLPKPVSPHGASKLAAEHVIHFMSNFYNLPSIILRIFSVYGSYMRPQTLIPLYIDRLKKNLPIDVYSDMNTKRDFLYIDDIVNFIKATFNKRIIYQIINVASGESFTLKEMAEKVAQSMGQDPNRLNIIYHQKRFDKLVGFNTKADITRARKILKYSPITDINVGIKKTVDWYLSHPEILEKSTHHNVT